jgi:UDP-N-acetylmuramyl pentapeptide phosphotransferase/UDP-N-acetylglucosamine-1-phosphate transferase
LTDSLVALAVAIAVASAAVAALARFAARLPQAHPSARSLHDRPIPRVGGIAVWLAAVPVAIAHPPALSGSAFLWLAAWSAVAVVSLVDDWRHVPVAVRLAVHASAALALAIAIAGHASPLAVAIAALAIAWGMNLYNFMDGSDGLAATMTVAGFGAYAIALACRDQSWTACAALVAGAGVFLLVNRPPASMFLGDVGAVPAGMLAAAVGIDGVVRGTWPWWFPLLVFLPFVLDASATLARRMARGERVVEAHRSHYYQRLLQLGFGHGGTLAVFGALMAACAVAALGCLLRAPDAGPYALATLVAVHAVLFATIDYHWGRQGDSR